MSAVDVYNRLALQLVMSGAAEDEESAMRMLARLRLHIAVSQDVSEGTRLAADFVARCAVRSFLGRVTYEGPELPELARMGVTRGIGDAFTIGIGDVAADVWLRADGLRGGVVTRRDQARVEAWSPAIAVAAGCAVGVAYRTALWTLNICDRTGRRIGDPRIEGNGVDVLAPGTDWLKAEPQGLPRRLPAEAWVLGCGNLGQAFLAVFSKLPFEELDQLRLMLQDTDRIKFANVSTSILTSAGDCGEWKTRVCARALQECGINARIIEQRFGAHTRATDEDPKFLFCGVDNLPTRRQLEEKGFSTIIDAGLGAESWNLTTFRITAFPSERPAKEVYANVPRRSQDRDFYRNSKDFKDKAAVDECGAELIGETSVGIPYVGLIVAALAVGQLISTVNGYPTKSILGGDVRRLEGIESATGRQTSVLATGPAKQ